MADVLVVDDDVQTRKVMRLLLQKEGHCVAEASDGVAALRFLQENTVDLVVTDIVMPDMDGLELTLKTRKAYPRLKILAVSGAGRGGPALYLNLAKCFGADAVLSKPFEPDRLIEEVKKLVGERLKAEFGSQRAGGEF